jgi:hypothetical protein
MTFGSCSSGTDRCTAGPGASYSAEGHPPMVARRGGPRAVPARGNTAPTRPPRAATVASAVQLVHRSAGAPGQPVRFTEMLPGPQDCWLHGHGRRYTSELRLVAVDLQRRASEPGSYCGRSLSAFPIGNAHSQRFRSEIGADVKMHAGNRDSPPTVLSAGTRGGA